MNKHEKKQRFALTLLFSTIVFCILLLTVLIVGFSAFWLVEAGIFTKDKQRFPNTTLLIFLIACASLVVGTVVTAFFGKITLKPVNTIINGMNRLASGDYRIRITLGNLIGRHPTLVELSNSFNKMAEDLESTEMLRSDFINNFSHEFKTPIVSIAGFAKLLNKGNLTEQQKTEYLKIIEEESLRLSYMATNVLNLTKVENQTILTDVSRYNLSEQLRSCVLLLEEKWVKKNLDFHLEFGEHMILANEELLKQVWINLIDNAIKFSPADSAIEISVKEREQTISVSVINRGSEISPENQKRIFNKFYQADESHSSEGNGIGLAIVKRIAELHQGKVTVRSDNNITTFTVELPKNK